MRVFLTGGTGYVGSFLVHEFIARGHELTILSREPSKHSHLMNLPGVSLAAGGLEDATALEALLAGHQACIHNAVIWHGEAERELSDLRRARWLFDAAARAGVGQMIYTSSTAVHRPFKAFMSEQDVLTPTDEYGATKAGAELFLSAISYRSEMRCNVIRAAPVVGMPPFAGVKLNTDRRFDQLLKKAKDGEDVSVMRGDGRQFIAGGDLARVFSAALESARNRETYLAVAADYVTWEDIARLIVAEVGSKSRVCLDGNVDRHSFDCTKIEREFGLRFVAWPAVREMVRHLAAAI